MDIKTKYNFGDKVQQIWMTKKTEFKKCSFCDGCGKIYGKDGNEKQCPQCYGRLGWDVQVGEGFAIEKELTIGEVRIEWKCDYKSDSDTPFDNYGDQTEYFKEVYMCYETGIGSGTLWPVERLFPTIEEAQAECDRLNSTDLES